ncbi:MAG: alanine racemase [Actinomycetota bacterium]|nr:alanine racemase [Actinomycetota bacterium]MDA3013672.1 alanine racemase [Actinomycetota bacterium]
MDRGFIYVNSKNLIHNLDLIQKNINKQLCLVVKASAYGHGINWAVKNAIKKNISWFAVASINEAIEVRSISDEVNILLLSEPSESEISKVYELGIDLTVYNSDFIKNLIKSGHNFNVHLKVDTGMHRIGCEPEKFYEIYNLIINSNLKLRGICTHFPTADVDSEFTFSAVEKFRKLLEKINISDLLIHVDNSASSFYNFDNIFNLSRIGIAAYGVSISAQKTNLKLLPTMEIKTRISNIQMRSIGESVSYGHALILERDSVIATAPIGYADGYPWNSFPDGKVIISNKFCKLIGRVTMDQILIDVTDVEAKINDEVVILGKSQNNEISIDVKDIADWNKTIPWEILTNMSKRLERVEID